tara:strand:+ start:1445 stop:1600 length:156 start_codon:yes stop_codon:yes gene_type:complete
MKDMNPEMESTKAHILAWLKDRLESVPFDALMEVRVEMAYHDEELGWMVEV